MNYGTFGLNTRLNHITGWLFIIGTPQRARKLRGLLDRLPPGQWTKTEGAEPLVDAVDESGSVEGWVYTPPMCPTQVMFGGREAAKLYASEQTRPALDAWDTQRITKEDLRRLCYEVEAGNYRGPVFWPEKGWEQRTA